MGWGHTKEGPLEKYCVGPLYSFLCSLFWEFCVLWVTNVLEILFVTQDSITVNRIDIYTIFKILLKL